MNYTTLIATAFAGAMLIAVPVRGQDIDIGNIVAAATATIDQVASATEKLPPATVEKVDEAVTAANPPPTEKEVKNDAGTQAVIQMQDSTPPTAKDIKGDTAKKQVESILAKNGIKVGRTDDRYVSVVETYIPMTDEPAKDKSFFVKRDLMAKQLVLQMKGQIAEGIGTQYSAEEQYEIFGTNAVTTSKSAYVAQWPIFGVNILAQGESWDGKSYHMAIAAVWSKTLHKAVKATLLGEAVPGKPGKKSMGQWLEDRDLALVCGPRQFVNSDGTRVFLGIAAREIGVNAMRDQSNKQAAKASALSYLVFSLFSDVEQYVAHQAAMNLYENEDETASAEASEQINSRIAQRVDNRMIEGANEIYNDEVVHPLSGKQVYVSVYALDAKSAAKARVMAEELIATRVATELANKRALGRNQGYRDQVERAKANTAEFEKGRAEGGKAVQDKLATPKGRAVNAVGGGTAAPAAPKSQQGVFSGEAEIDNDF